MRSSASRRACASWWTSQETKTGKCIRARKETSPARLSSSCGSRACPPQRRLVHRFAQRRMRVHDAREILGRALEFHRDDGLGDSSDTSAPTMCTPRMRSVSACAMTFTRPAGSFIATARPIAANGKLPVLYGMPSSLHWLLGLADPGDLGLGVDHPRNRVEIHVAGLAGDDFGDRDAFLEALVREHRPAHAVADRPDAFDAGAAMLVDDDAAAIVELDAGAVAEQRRRCRRGDRPRRAACRRRASARRPCVGVGEVDFVALDLGFATASRRARC